MKVSNFRSIASIAVLTASSIALQACGTQNKLNAQGVAGYQGNTLGTQTSSSGTLQQRCSPMPNVTGQGYYNSLDRQFRVCKGTNIGGATSQIAIFPEDAANKQVCVFPVQAVNGRPAVFVVNPYTAPAGRYLVQCGGIAGSGSVMNFSNVNFQGAYIVNYSDAANFAGCIATGDAASCAVNSNIGYSLGYWN